MNPATNRQCKNAREEFTLMLPAGEGLFLPDTDSAGRAEQSGDFTELALSRRDPAKSAQKRFPA
jgi:hypothetical protein